MSYEAPLRCQRCGALIEKKPGAKLPKYCPPCRAAQQAEFKENNANNGKQIHQSKRRSR